jgi:NAD(P)H-hydrate epimerase
MTATNHASIPAVDPTVMAAVDRRMIDALGVDVLQLMELAGLAVARAAASLLPDRDPRDRPILLLCGRGGNGGDGLVAARLLLAWGARPAVILSHPADRLADPAARNLASVRALGIPVTAPPPDSDASPALPPAELIIDALLGFGLAGPPAGRTATLIRAANDHPAPILAVDLPSGLDAATGVPHAPCIRADRTITLALPKTGLLAPGARPFTGPVDVADIGIPPAVYAALGIDIPPLFARSNVLPVLP